MKPIYSLGNLKTLPLPENLYQSPNFEDQRKFKLPPRIQSILNRVER